MEKKCRFCPRVCHKQEHLDRHERTHTKVRPYRCDACEKHFVRSDTLKRHQKLHVDDGSKAAKRGNKGSKRNRAGSNCDATQSDLSTESSVDHSPLQEVSEPQFFYDTTETWPVGLGFNSNLFGNDTANYFEESYPAFEDSSIGSAGSEFPIKSEFIWDQL